MQIRISWTIESEINFTHRIIQGKVVGQRSLRHYLDGSSSYQIHNRTRHMKMKKVTRVVYKDSIIILEQKLKILRVHIPKVVPEKVL